MSTGLSLPLTLPSPARTVGSHAAGLGRRFAANGEAAPPLLPGGEDPYYPLYLAYGLRGLG